MIDTHCHINDDMYSHDPFGYVKEAQEAGVSSFLIIGCNLKDSIKAVEIANKIDCCYAAVGIHPSDVKKVSDKDLQEIEKLLDNKKVLAIGEIGLDFYWDKDKEVQSKQREFFIKQIELANKHNLPIVIHNRDAAEECLKIIKNHPAKKGGIMHCYSGSLEMAKEFVKQGLLLGFGGVTTFKNGVKAKEIVSQMPLEHLVLETDSPYLTPEPFRGQPNHSKYLKYVCQKISELKNVNFEEVENKTTNNFKKVFLK